MKKIFTLISAMVISLSLFAQQDESARRGAYNLSRLSISTVTDNQLRILIDGKSYNTRSNDNDILISDIRPGYHNIKVYQQKSGRFGNGKKVNRNMQLVYDANLYIRAQYHTDISINRFGRAFIDERQMNAGYYADNDENDHDGNGWGYNDNYMQPMSNRSFDQFRESLRKENFDNTRVVLAKQTIAANYFSAAQVKELVNLFSFENNKLDIAKHSYKYTVDKNNYFTLNDAFAFSSSKEELARYIQAYR